MSRIIRLLVTVSMLMVPVLTFGASTAQAADGYGSTPVASVEITVQDRYCKGRPARAEITVSSDAEDAVGPVSGTVKVYLDGKLIKKMKIDNGSFRTATTTSRTVTIPSKNLPLGQHTVTADLEPEAGSPYQGSSASASFRVVDCDGGVLPDTGGDDDGILPDTGGFWIGLLIIALLLLALGAWLVRRRNADER